MILTNRRNKAVISMLILIICIFALLFCIVDPDGALYFFGVLIAASVIGTTVAYILYGIIKLYRLCKSKKNKAKWENSLGQQNIPRKMPGSAIQIKEQTVMEEQMKESKKSVSWRTIKEKKMELARKEAEVKAKEAYLNSKESELDTRSQNIKAEQERLYKYDLELKKYRDYLMSEKEKVDKFIREQNSIISKQQEEIDRKSDLIDETSNQIEDLVKAITERQEELIEWEHRLNEADEELEEKKETVAKLENEMIERMRILDLDENRRLMEMMENVGKYLNYSNLSGEGFESYVAMLLKTSGYTDVKTTQKSGDYGVDILAERDGVKYAIQCKHYKSMVGLEAVQQVNAGKDHYRANCAIVATNSIFTKQAKTLAESVGVVLWDGEKLNQMATAVAISKVRA